MVSSASESVRTRGVESPCVAASLSKQNKMRTITTTTAFGAWPPVLHPCRVRLCPPPGESSLRRSASFILCSMDRLVWPPCVVGTPRGIVSFARSRSGALFLFIMNLQRWACTTRPPHTPSDTHQFSTLLLSRVFSHSPSSLSFSASQTFLCLWPGGPKPKKTTASKKHTVP